MNTNGLLKSGVAAAALTTALAIATPAAAQESAPPAAEGEEQEIDLRPPWSGRRPGFPAQRRCYDVSRVKRASNPMVTPASFWGSPARPATRRRPVNRLHARMHS